MRDCQGLDPDYGSNTSTPNHPSVPSSLSEMREQMVTYATGVCPSVQRLGSSESRSHWHNSAEIQSFRCYYHTLMLGSELLCTFGC